MPPDRAHVLLGKAKADEAAAVALMDNPSVPDDIVGFHCQQAVEKLLKSLLSQLGVHYAKVHNLRHLMELLSHDGCPIPREFEPLEELTPFAVLHRYASPEQTGEIDAKHVCKLIAHLREWVEPQIV